MVGIGGESVVETDVAEVIAHDLPWRSLNGTRILVTGAAGMLPSYTIRTLFALNDRHRAGIAVVGLVRDGLKAQRMLGEALDRHDFTLLVQDVTDPVSLSGPIDWIVHGASPARPALHRADPIGTIKANVLGTFNLLDLAVRERSRGFVLMSSAEVYGAQSPRESGLIGEDSYGGIDILDPRACYSEGKRAAETIAAVYQAQSGVRCHVLRFGHVYGPGMALDDGRVQADFAADVLAGRDIVLNSDGSAVRTYTYVSDAIAGMFYAMLLGTETAYNVADAGTLVSIRELGTAFTKVRPHKNLQLLFSDAADARSYSPVAAMGLDSTKLAGLGWRPLVSLSDGLDRMLSHLEMTHSRHDD